MANRFKKRNNMLPMECVLVGTGSQAMANGTAGGTLSGAGLVKATGTAFGISNGQIGAMSVDMDSATLAYGTFLVAGNTISTTSAIQLTQGTPLSSATQLANQYQVGHQPVIKSPIIRAGKVLSVTTLAPALGTYNSEHFNSFTATPLDLSDYSLRVTLGSVRNDLTYGDNDEVLSSTFVSPEYSDAVVAAVLTNPLDHLLQNIIVPINYQSKLASASTGGAIVGNKNVVVFGLDSAGGTGQVLGTIVAGTIIPVMTDTSANLTYTATTEFVRTVTAWIAAGVSATATIELLDLSTAGQTGAAAIDSFIVMGLDEDTSLAFDNVQAIKTRVTSTLGDGFLLFPAPVKEVVAYALEARGLGRDWTIENDDRARLAIHTMQNHPHGEYFTRGETYVDPAKLYTSTIIDYFDEEDTLTTSNMLPKQAIILLEATVTNPIANANTGYTIATTNTATVTSLNLILSVWLTSERVLSNHAIKGSAVAGTYFV